MSKVVVELTLLNKLTAPLDMAQGKVKRLAKTTKAAFVKAAVAVRGFMGAVSKVSQKIFNFKNLIIAAAAGATVKYFYNAAAAVEVFAKQLEIVTGSAKRAGEVLSVIREFARKSPLETEDVVQSYVRLRAVGIDPTMQQMKTLGGVAVLMNRDLTEILDSFIGLNKRTLRRLGIDIDRTGQKAVIQSGNIKRVVEKDTASIREALLEVWAERFPNAIVAAAGTSRAQTAIMKSNVWELAAAVGKELLPAWNAIAKVIGKIAFNIKEMLEPTWERQAKQAKFAIKLAKKRIAQLESENGATEILVISKGRVVERVIDEATHTQRLLLAKKELLIQEKRLVHAQFEMAKARTLGKGVLGTKDEDDDGGAAAKKAAAERLKLYKFEAKARKESAEAIKKFQDELIKDAIKRFDRMVDLSNKEIRLGRKRDAEEKKMADASQKRRDDDLDKERDLINEKIRLGMRLGSALSNLARIAINESKASARAKKNMLYAMAIADAGAAAVAGLRSAMELSFPYNLIAGAATVAEVAAIAATEISAIKNASFAGGTQSAPGGLSLVGEQGPELMNVPRGAQIFNNTQTRQMIGGANININIGGNADSKTVSQLKGVAQDLGKMLENGTRLGNIDWQRIGVATI